jgi:hypothetical protein
MEQVFDRGYRFMTLSDREFAHMDGITFWNTRTQFTEPRDAVSFAQVREHGGAGVAFAKYGDFYYVWSE